MQKLVYDHHIRVIKKKNKMYLSLDNKKPVEVKDGYAFGFSRIIETNKWELLKGLVSGKIILLQDIKSQT